MLSWCWACLSLIANLDWNRVQMSSKLNADYFHVMLMFVIWIKRSPNAKFNESITSFSRFQKGIWNVEFLNPRQIFKLNVTVNAKYIWIWIINLLNECFMTPFSYWGSLRLYLKTNDDFFSHCDSFEVPLKTFSLTLCYNSVFGDGDVIPL